MLTNKDLLKMILEKLSVIEDNDKNFNKRILNLENIIDSKNNNSGGNNNNLSLNQRLENEMRAIDKFYLAGIDPMKPETGLETLNKVSLFDYGKNISLEECRKKYFKPPITTVRLIKILSLLSYDQKELTNDQTRQRDICKINKIQDFAKYIKKAALFKPLDTPEKLDKLFLAIINVLATVIVDTDLSQLHKKCEVSHLVVKAMYNCGYINLNVIENKTKLFYDTVKFFNLSDIEYKKRRGNNYIDRKELLKIKGNALKHINHIHNVQDNPQVKVLLPSDIKTKAVKNISKHNTERDHKNIGGQSRIKKLA